MTAYFTDSFRAYLRDNLTSTFPLELTVYFFPTAPNFLPNDARYTGIDSVDQLTTTLGWGPYIGVQAVPFSLGTMTQGGTTYVIFNNPLDIPEEFPTYTVRAMAVVANDFNGADRIIMVSNTPFAGRNVVFNHNDSIVARQDTNAGNQRWMMAWAAPGAAPSVDPIEGPLTILKGAPDYETSHTQHAWLFPQRVNLVANPSFEGGVHMWRTNGTAQQIGGGSPGGGYRAGRFTGPAPIIAESNYFPVVIGKKSTEEWTIQLMARGNGQMRVGLISWPQDYNEVYVDWGTPGEVYDLSPQSFKHVYALRKITDSDTAQVRIECQGTELILDNVLAEPDFLLYWPYFDGDSTYGARDDFSWYNGENAKGKSYSLWYNNRRAVVGRLFAWGIAETDPTITDEEIAKQGYVYNWVPAGTRVIPHLDVLFVNDVRNDIVDIEDTDVTPDVEDPWDQPDVVAPTAPTNLVATAAGTTSINLIWTPSTDATGVVGYRIERCIGGTCTNFNLIRAVGTVTTFTDIGLVPGVTYSYRVAAIDAAGNVSHYSNVARATTEGADTEPPTAPTNLTATPSPGRIDLEWDASTDNVGVAYYIIERCKNEPEADPSVLLESFDDLSAWTNVSSASIVPGRTGTAVKSDGYGDGVFYDIPVEAQSDIIVLGVAYKMAGFPEQPYIFSLFGPTARHTRVLANPNGALVAGQDPAGIGFAGSAAGLLVINTWQYIEVQIKLSNTSTGWAKGRINGVEVFNVTNVQTTSTTNAQIGKYTRIELGSHSSSSLECLFDDFYIRTGPGATFRGDVPIT